jgi:prepilin-type N-terminal cleavage/methylation domain-containing protein
VSLGDRQRWARAGRGYTLVELMVTMTILSVVLGAVYYAFFRAQSSARQTTRVVDARQGSRAALQLLEREVRMVGSGWGRIPIYGARNGAPMTLHAVEPGFTTAAGNDSLELLGGWDAGTTLRSPMFTSAAGSVIPCVSTAGFGSNDFVLVTNGSTAHIFQVTAVSGTPADLDHSATSIYNTAGGHMNWPAGGYPAGSRVYRVSWVTYKVDSTGFSTPCLTRRDQGSVAQVVATDVSAFHVWYLLQDATETRDPVDLSLIDKIRPVIQTQVADRGSAVLTDSVWTMVRPRTF